MSRWLGFGSAAAEVASEAEPLTRFAVDETAVPPSVFGLAAYEQNITQAARVDRRTAMQVPAVKRSRDLICGPLGTLPLSLVGPDQTRTSSALFDQPERDVPRSVTMTKTIEDLLYEGVAWWLIVSFDWRGYPAEVVRLDPRSVDVLADGRVHVTGDGHRGTSTRYPADRELIRFDSPNDALLVAGARAIRTAALLDKSAANAADGTPPVSYFTPAEGADPADDDDVAQFLADYQQARRDGSTGYIPAALALHFAGWNPEQLQLAEARQHAVLEIARVAGVDPEELGVSTTSRTYMNAYDRRKQFVDFTLGGYRAAIEDRLSMGDVMPRGYRARFDLDDFLRSDPKSRYEAYKVGLEVGALIPAEVRQAEDRPALTAAPAPAKEAPVAASEPAPAAVFADDATTTFEAPSAPEVFSVDRETRTIRGLALPWNSVAMSGGRRWSFAKDSIQFGDVKRVKLLAGHDWTQALGHAVSLESTDEGLVAAFKVARGPEGDRALSLAEDGVWDGLSVGLGQGIKATAAKDGVTYATAAPLREISLTPCPAYDDARITSVAASAENEGAPMTEIVAPEALDFSAITDAITSGFATLQAPQGGERETVSAGRPLEVTEQPLYRFDGIAGQFGFVEDLRAANFGDSEARQRIDEFTTEAFAVTSGNVGTLNPTVNRPDLYVPNLTYTRPLWDSVSTGTVTDKVPFSVPKFGSATGLVGAHVEGVEPTPGAFTATSQTISPSGVSGKIEINREVLDQGGSPQADAIIWGEMLNGWYEALEARVAAALTAVPTAEVNLASATGAALVSAVENQFLNLQFARGGHRYSGFVADGMLFRALAGAADTTGRPLLPITGATNADGALSGGFDRISLGNQTVRAAWALGSTNASRSYIFVPSSVWAWASAPRKFVFEYQVKSIDLAIWGYAATAVLRDSDVIPVDYTTADA